MAPTTHRLGGGNKRGRAYVIQGQTDPDSRYRRGSYLFSVSFIMMFPRVEKTMKDILSMGLRTHICFTLMQKRNRQHPEMRMTNAACNVLSGLFSVRDSHVFLLALCFAPELKSLSCWLVQISTVPDELLRQLLHEGVNLDPLILHASRSEKQQEYHFIRKKKQAQLTPSYWNYSCTFTTLSQNPGNVINKQGFTDGS